MLCVAAAGNDSVNNDIYPHYPSSYTSENIIAVLATDKYDNISSFSNYGLTSVDLGAPGSDIYSCRPGNSYQYLSGTSMATPHVAGACALVWSACPSMHYSVVKNTILQSVDPLTPLQGLCVSGGRLNLYNATIEVGAQWIQFASNSGTVTARDSNDITVTFNAERPAGTYQGEITVSSNDPLTPQAKIPVTMVIEPVDYLTELFDPNSDPNGNDIANKTLTFSPLPNGYYTVCVDQATDFPVDPAGGTTIAMKDDDYVPITLLNTTVPFCGIDYDTFYIGSNGYITFDTGDTRLLETLEDHFDLPRISALFDDLDPSSGGTISWKQLDNGVVVTFENVPEYNSSGTNSFQIEMRFNGKIRITFLNIAAHDGLVGLSDGYGLPLYFTETNFSHKAACNFAADFSGDQSTDFFDFAIFAQCERKQYDNISTETIRDEFNTISYGGNDGTQDWSGNWQELGESDGPDKGFLQVVSGHDGSYMRLGPQNKDAEPLCSLTRQANLSRITSAILTYDYTAANKGIAGSASIQISPDGGSNWTTLATYTSDSGSGSESFDIISYASADTQIRFEIGGKTAMCLYIDNVQVEYVTEPHYDPYCNPCDFNQDLLIDLDDLMTFAEHWLE